MTATLAETRSVVVERDVPFPPEKIWRALTQPHLGNHVMFHVFHTPAIASDP